MCCCCACCIQQGVARVFCGYFYCISFLCTYNDNFSSFSAFFLFLLHCCTLAGAWKANSDDNARQRAARGRQSRFYTTFYDCQQWAETERHPCRIVCPIDISFMWSLWACHLHYFHYILLDNFAVFVCVCVVISCCTLMIVSLSPSVFCRLWGVLKIQSLNWKYLRLLRSTSCHTAKVQSFCVLKQSYSSTHDVPNLCYNPKKQINK